MAIGRRASLKAITRSSSNTALHSCPCKSTHTLTAVEKVCPPPALPGCKQNPALCQPFRKLPFLFCVFHQNQCRPSMHSDCHLSLDGLKMGACRFQLIMHALWPDSFQTSALMPHQLLEAHFAIKFTAAKLIESCNHRFGSCHNAAIKKSRKNWVCEKSIL